MMSNSNTTEAKTTTAARKYPGKNDNIGVSVENPKVCIDVIVAVEGEMTTVTERSTAST